MRTDFCYRSKRDALLHFGLGQADSVTVRIETRTGEIRLFNGLDANQTHLLDLTG